MKIIHVTHSFFPYSYGGRERMVLEWSKCVSKRNDVTILTSSDRLLKLEVKKFGKINVYYLPSFTINLVSSIYRIPPFVLFFLLERDFDICHAHDFHHFTTLLSTLACRIKGKPIVLSYHGIYKSNGILSILTKVYEVLFLKFIINSVRYVIVPSEFSKNEIINEFKIPKEKIIKIPNFISFENLKTRIDFKKKYNLNNYILAVGRFSKEKGFEYLLKSFKLVLEKRKDIKLVVIGGKRDYIRVIEKFANSLGILDNILILSNVSDEEVYSAFKYAELVVIPSIYEPFGIVVLEAMYFGKPIVAFKVGGLKEIVKNKVNGTLVRERNIEELANAIIKILSDVKMREKISRNNKNFVKTFDRRNFVDFVNNFYERILKKI
jgi:glycosyltransferase involved in cell wall biosynthesis